MEWLQDIVNSADYEKVIKIVEMGGPLAGMFLPVVEAFVPILPLVLFVTINIGVFGFWLGYLYSWLGTCLGSYLLFLLIRKIGGKKLEKKIMNSKYKVALEKVQSNNFSVLFILYCFPFSPSFLLSGTSALANMSSKDFLVALLPSKLIMLISLALIGANVSTFFEKPLRSVAFILGILMINFIIKKIVEKTDIFVVKRKKNK